MQYSAVINQTDGDLLNFDISNSLTIGFELDYELDLSYMLARADRWGLGVTVSQSNGSANTLRAGIDAYIEMLNFNKRGSMDLILFTSMDRFFIESTETDEDSDYSITSIQYNQYYGGLGVAYSW